MVQSLTLYNLPVESQLTEANIVPVGLKAISSTSSLWSSKLYKQVPLRNSQSLTVLSKDEVAA